MCYLGKIIVHLSLDIFGKEPRPREVKQCAAAPQNPDTWGRDPAWVAQTLSVHTVSRADYLVPPGPHCEVRDAPEVLAIRALSPSLVISKSKPLCFCILTDVSEGKAYQLWPWISVLWCHGFHGRSSAVSAITSDLKGMLVHLRPIPMK